jgi:hypothetical protein
MKIYILKPTKFHQKQSLKVGCWSVADQFGGSNSARVINYRISADRKLAHADKARCQKSMDEEGDDQAKNCCVTPSQQLVIDDPFSYQRPIARHCPAHTFNTYGYIFTRLLRAKIIKQKAKKIIKMYNKM